MKSIWAVIGALGMIGVASHAHAENPAKQASFRIMPEDPQSPMESVPDDLAPGETMLLVTGIGEVRSPAESVTFVLFLMAQGSTQAGADAALARQLESLNAALNDLGATIDDSAAPGTAGFIGNEMIVDECEEEGCADAGATGSRTSVASRQIRVTVNDMRLIDQVRRVLQAERVAVNGVLPVLADEASARREAISRAIADARLEAETYARSLDRQIVRTIYVVDDSRNDSSAFMGSMMRRMRGDVPEDIVLTEARVKMAVVLSAE